MCTSVSILLWIRVHDKNKQWRDQYDLIQKFTQTYRYLSDILAINIDDFCLYTKYIYPTELTRTKLIMTINIHIFWTWTSVFVTEILIQKFTTKETIVHSLSLTILFSMVIHFWLIHMVFKFPKSLFWTGMKHRFWFNERNIFIINKLLHQGFRYHTLG